MSSSPIFRVGNRLAWAAQRRCAWALPRCGARMSTAHPPLEDLPTDPLCFGHPTRLVGLQQPFRFAPHRPHRAGKAGMRWFP
jgi:hypothetical protein